MKEDASILIILMGSLGDVARGLGVVSPLKEASPACRITWLVEPRCYELVKAHPQIDEILVFDRPRGMAAFLQLRTELAQRHFDITLDMQRHLKSGLFSRLSGAPRRVGFHPGNSKEFNWVFNNEHIPHISPSHPKLENYLEFARMLGGSIDKVDFGLKAEAFAPFFPAGKLNSYVLLVLGASKPEKNWTENGYRELINIILSGTSLDLVLTGSPGEAPLGARLAQGDISRIHNFAGTTSLSELIALVSRARVCSGPDSGPGHIAAMFGVPYVALFGPTDPDRVAPYGMRELVVQAEGREMREISAQAVFERVQCILGSGDPVSGG